MMENNNEQPKPKRRYKKRTKKVTPIKEVNEIPMYDPYTGEPNPHYEELTGKSNPLTTPKPFSLEDIANKARKGLIKTEYHNKPTKEFVDFKTNNRFLVLFPEKFGITPTYVKSVTRPSLVIKKGIIGRKLEISPIVIELIDLIKEEFKLNVKLNEILKEHKRFNLTIQTVNPKELVIEEMELSDCYISELNFSPLSYSDDNLSVTTITIKPNDFTIK
jgi:hypothetical protein